MDGVTTLLVVLLVQLVRSEEVSSCEGFVKPAKNLPDVQLEYHKIHLQLMNDHGHVKDTVELSPIGFFAIPIFDTGVFKLRIKGPEGWVFEPKEVKIKNSPDHKPCAKDVNFSFVGFTLSGAVVPEGCKSDGATQSNVVTGVQIRLTGGGQEMTTTTDKSGKFSFSPLGSGKYTLVPSRHRDMLATDINPTLTGDSKTATYPLSWSFANGPRGHAVEIKNDNVVLDTDIRVTGYAVVGNVESEGVPVLGTEVSVHAKTTDKELQRVKSDKNGIFMFKDVPCASYYLVPHHKSFQINPSKIEFSVTNSDVLIKEFFTMLGFEMKGSVVGADGKGIPSVKVSVEKLSDHKMLTATTDSSGEFLLPQIQVGHYTLRASLLHHTFKELTNIHIAANRDKLPPIVAEQYALCGRITVDPSFTSSGRAVQIKSDSGATINVKTQAGGTFCTDVVPNQKYTVTPIVDAKEKDKGLSIQPSSHPVSMGSSPVVGIQFSQSLVKIKGAVKCIETCPENLRIHLSHTTRIQQNETALQPDGTFVFENVLVGKYKVSVIRRDDWCWEKTETTITVGDSDYEGLVLKQTGYKITYVLTHDSVVLNIKNNDKPDAPVIQKTITKNGKHICLEKPGDYTVTPQSCFRFERDEFRFNTKAASILEFIVDGFKLEGTIEVDSTYIKDLDKDKVGMVVHVTSQSGNSKTATAGSHRPDLTPKTHKRDNHGQLEDGEAPNIARVTFVEQKNKKHIFRYSYWTSPNDDLLLTPRSHHLLFYPESHVINIPANECPEKVPTFTGRDGMYIDGKITPAIQGVMVRVVLKHDDTEQANTVSDKDGTFHVGPLYEDREYQLRLAKKGYVFTEIEGSQGREWAGRKLATISIKAIDKDTKQPLSGVFVSLSGKDYRNSTTTTKDGEQSFINLSPGSFYLRYQLKEYQFEPSTKTIQLDEGELEEVEVAGTRVAFSCFGVVTSLNGQPEASVVVEALAGNGAYEEATTDKAGLYRLRGLLPGTEYSISVRSMSSKASGVNTGGSDEVSKIERASPEVVMVNITEEQGDVQDVNFVAFRSTGTFTITGFVDVEPEFIDDIEVQLIQPFTEVVLRTVQVYRTQYFEMPSITPPVGGTTFLVRLNSNLPKHTYSVSSTNAKVIAFTRDGNLIPVVDVQLKFDASIQEDTQEITGTPFMALLFIIVVVLCVRYWNVISPWLRQVVDDLTKTGGRREYREREHASGEGGRRGNVSRGKKKN